jgi:predicted dinucleotide-binding enzyme
VKIAFLGHGQVGGALATSLRRLGHDVTLAARDPGSAAVRALLARSPSLRVAAPPAALAEAELGVLATPFQSVAEALPPLRAALAGKILVDCTNPVGPGLTHGLGSRQSGTEAIQALLPDTRVVKAFSIYGFENLEDPSFPGAGVKSAMLYCGDDAAAKAQVAGLLSQLGWEPLDVGGAAQALHLEHMTLLWVRLVRVGGHSPRLAWAALTR